MNKENAKLNKTLHMLQKVCFFYSFCPVNPLAVSEAFIC